MTTDSANFQQRVFDAFPPYPQYITVFAIRQALPTYAVESIRKAVQRLIRLALLEPSQATRRVVLYRKRHNARRPIDMRGRHGKSGRKPKASHAHL